MRCWIARSARVARTLFLLFPLVSLALAVPLFAQNRALSRPEAEKLIQSHGDFAEPVRAILLSDVAIDGGIREGVWQQSFRNGPQLILTELGRDYFTRLDGLLISNAYLAEPVKRGDLQITGITDGPLGQGKEIQFTWRYVGLSSLVARYTGQSQKPHASRALARLYDDGWRIEKMELRENSRVPFSARPANPAPSPRPAGAGARSPAESDSVGATAALTAMLSRNPSALGKYTVRHAHRGASLLSSGEWSSCLGVLFVFPDHVEYAPVSDTDGQRHPLSIQLTDIQEAALNRLPVGELGAFHLTLKDKQNFNFATQDDRRSMVATIQKAIAESRH